MRWSANFTPVLEELGCKITYAVDKEGRNKVLEQFGNIFRFKNKCAGHSESGDRWRRDGNSLERISEELCG